MGIKPGYKQTDLGDIPESWEIKSINNIAEILGGGTPNTFVSQYWDGQIPWVSAGDVSRANGRYIYDTMGHISEIGLASCPTNIVPAGTSIIIARGATTGRIAQLEKAMAFNQTCYALIPIDGFDQNFLYYGLLFSVNSLNSLKYGTTFSAITTNSFDGWKIPVPPTLTEQKAIAEVLSDADALIESLEALILKKSQIKQGAMQELLTGQRRLLGFSGKWEKRKIGKVLKLNYGRSQQGIISDFGEYPILGTGGEVGRTNDFLYDQPSVIIGRKGTIDVPQYVDIPFWSIDTTYYTEIINNLCPKFIFYLFTTINWYLYNEASGVPSLSSSTILNIEIKIPIEKKEQEAIAQILSDMDAEIEALEEKLTKARQIKEGMMQELLTGRIRLI